MAILKRTVAAINEEEAPGEGLHLCEHYIMLFGCEVQIDDFICSFFFKLALHIVDTCSPADRNADTTLKNLIKSQQPCKDPPLLLG